MEAVGTLAAGVAHDFNNQLTVIAGYTELAADMAEGNVELRESLSEIRRAAAASASLTRQLLTFSRKQVLQATPIEVTATVQASGRLLQKAIGDDIVLEVRSPDEQLWIVADAVELEHLLLNLVVNARDAMPNAGRITIEMHAVQLDEPPGGALLQVTPGEYVAITVSDTGVGMSKEVQARIFEPFFTTKATGKGTGLGLAMVYGSVQQMRGSIWVYSEPDQGTTFKMYLPRTTDTGRPPASASRTETLLHGTETILVTDDDDGVRAFIVRCLRRTGYTVLAAATPDEAISIAREQRGTIDLLITDVVMPQMLGPSLAQILVGSTGLRRVLYTSGYANHPQLAEQIRRGDVQFLPKPYTPPELSRAVRQALDRDLD
jgi:CheY-like chemotaxis protein/two-component sensor histidine kinase